MSRTVATYNDNHNILRPLIKMLNAFGGLGSPNPIPEIMYLHQISETGTVPGNTFYSRIMITYVINRHRAFMENVRSDPSLSERFYCQYYVDGQRRTYEFSNTMSLHADIITLMYLYMLLCAGCDHLLVTRKLKTLMINKYMIVYEDVFCATCKINYETCEVNCENVDCFSSDPRMVTISRIYESYVSVMFWMFRFVSVPNVIVRTVFPYSKLPPLISSSYFPIILSRSIGLDDKHLLAMHMAICADDQKMFPILSIYRHMHKCTVSFDVYTEDMRIDICLKLGIVINREGKYLFPRKLEKHRPYYVIAKDKLRRLRANDVTLKETIEKINELFS